MNLPKFLTKLIPKASTKTLDLSKYSNTNKEEAPEKKTVEVKKAAPKEETQPLRYVPKDPMTKGSWKFSEYHKKVLIDLIAEGLTYSQLYDTCQIIHGFTISPSLVFSLRNSRKWEDRLKEARQRFYSSTDMLDVSNRYTRVKRLDDVQERAIKKGDLSNAIKANSEIRKEFEKDSGDINIMFNSPVYQQFNSLSNEELIARHQEATKRLKQKEITDGPDRSSDQEVSEHESRIKE